MTEDPRALDKRVAEKLGWTEIKVERVWDDILGDQEIMLGVEPSMDLRIEVPWYSHNMNAAMKLWNKEWLLTQCATGTWHIDLYYGSEHRLSTAPAPAKAICLAFLREK